VLCIDVSYADSWPATHCEQEDGNDDALPQNETDEERARGVGH